MEPLPPAALCYCVCALCEPLPSPGLCQYTERRYRPRYRPRYGLRYHNASPMGVVSF